MALTDKCPSANRVGTFVFEGLATIIGRRSFREIALFLAFALLCLGIAAIAAVLLYPIDTLEIGPVENGWYESAQTVVLGLTTLIVLRLLVISWHEIFYFSAGLAMLLPLAMVRETPRCGSHYYDGGACLTEDGKVLTVSIAIAVVIAILAIRRVPVAKAWRELTFFYAVPAAFSVSMLIGSEIFGKLVYVWAEETLEFAAYLNLLGLAVAVSIWPKWFIAASDEHSGD
ncbi:hypothetical protein [Fulvimarina sp. MAC8]|uniref:hypothetical protein n=1 Tax=Fulvimarina sp. MAC8 TaxID=3162874 RepID=UPI0032EE8773